MNRYLWIVITFGCLLGFSPLYANVFIEHVEAPKHFGNNTQEILVLDDNGYPHVVYGESWLYHTWFDGTDWQTETVDSSARVGGYASVALDSSGALHAAYRDSTHENLKYATNRTGAWQVQTIDTAENTGVFPSIALDSSDKVHISYLEESGGDYQLRYATNASGNWSTESLDTGSSVHKRGTSIGVDSTGKVHIAYVVKSGSDDHLKYITNKALNTWTPLVIYGDTVDGDFYYPSLAVAHNDKIHISFVDWVNGGLLYANNVDPSGWDTAVIDADLATGASNGNAISVDDSGSVYVTYAYDAGSEIHLGMITNTTGSFVRKKIETIGQNNTPVRPAIALDAGGYAHVAYVHSDYDAVQLDRGKVLKYAHNTLGAFSSTIIASWVSVGLYNAIAADSSGFLHIAYQDMINETLKYATNKTGTWETTVVDDDTLAEELYADIAVDALGRAHISYIDHEHSTAGVEGRLKYATPGKAGWLISVVDTDARARRTSIAVDSNHTPHIVYSGDDTTNILRYATRPSGSRLWSIQEPDADAISNGSISASIAVSANDVIHITYYDGVNLGLKWLMSMPAPIWWLKGTIVNSKDPVKVVGRYSDLAIDRWGHLHVSFFDGAIGAIRYATNGSGSWAFQTVGPSTFSLSRIAVDHRGHAHVRYNGEYDGPELYASNVNFSLKDKGMEHWPIIEIDPQTPTSGGDIVLVGNTLHFSYSPLYSTGLKHASTRIPIPATCNPAINALLLD